MNDTLSKKTVIFITSLALFMEALDSSILNTAVPTLSHALNINPINLKIALISYLLSLAIFIPISSWIADKYGAKHVFIAALSLFSLSSFYCGFAHHITELVVGRFLQGIGGALMIPTARLLMLRTISKNELIKAMGYVVMLAAVGVMLGPLLGGFIVDYFSWPWIFWLNIPVSLLAIFIAYTHLGKNQKQAVAPLDLTGFFLFGLGLASFSFALSSFSESSVSDLYSLYTVIFSLLLLLAYVWHSKNLINPIIKTELFRIRTFRLSVAANLLARLGFDGTPFLLPLLLQIGLGYSPLESGLLISPIALGIIIAKPLTNTLFHFLGYKRLLILNTALLAISVASFSLIDINTPLYGIVLLSCVYGFLVSIQYTGMNTLGYSDQTTENYGSATSIISTVQRLAQSFGVAASAFLIRLFSPDFSIQSSLDPNIFHSAFFAMGILTLLSLIIFSRLSNDDGQQMLNPNKKSV